MDQQPLSFQEWGRKYRGLGGVKIPNTKEGARMLAKLQEDYGTYVDGLQAPRVTFTNAPSGEPLAVLGNTMTKLGTDAPKVETMVGKDGALYAVNPQTLAALTITNAQGQPFQPAPKQPRGLTPEEMVNFGVTQPAAQQSPGVLGTLANFFSGGRGQPVASEQVAPAATPVPSPAPLATPVPAAAGDSRPPEVAVPVFRTKEEVREAYRTGKIDQAAAVKALQGM